MIAAVDAVAPAEQWRRNLALTLFDPEMAPIRLVFTCPPGNPQLAAGFVAPAIAHERFAEVFHGYIVKRTMHNRLSIGIAGEIGSEAYAPLEGHSGHVAQLAEQLRRELLEPHGAKGLLNAFLLDAKQQILGWVGIGTREPSLEALRELGPELTKVAREASRTLQATLDLAAGCGARVPPAVNSQVATLTRREMEIARMVAGGHSDLNIACSLAISENTVGSHLRRVYAKLGIHTRAEIGALISGLGVLDDPPPAPGNWASAVQEDGATKEPSKRS